MTAAVPILISSASRPDQRFTAVYLDETPAIEFRDLNEIPDDCRHMVTELAINTGPANSPSKITPELLPRHLANIIIIDSTNSGTKTSSSWYFSVIKLLFDALGLRHVYVSTTSADTISKHAKSFTSPSTVIFLSGDTSIHEFVNNLQSVADQQELILGVIPTGTGNALSSSIGHQGIGHAISRLILGNAEPLASYSVRMPKNSYFYQTEHLERVPPVIQSLVVTSWAFHASIVADSDTPEYRKLGRQRFSEAANDNIARDQLYRGEILDDKGNAIISITDHSYLLFTLLTNLESSFRISPAGRPPSSKDLYMVEIPHVSGPDILEVMMKVYDNAKHIEDDRVNYVKIQRPVNIRILPQKDDSEITRRFCIDGRIVVAEPTPGDDIVAISEPSYTYKGWCLKVIV